MLGLPDQIKGCLFDLDGVITQTAKVHSAAWKEMFDGFLRDRAEASGEPFAEFTASDYTSWVDGKPRGDGIRSFLGSRGIEIPDGEAGDGPEAETVIGLGTRKNTLFNEVLKRDGVDAYPGSIDYLERVREAGLPAAVVSSSANCKPILESAGLIDQFAGIIDGVVAVERGLAGKPAPDTFLAGAGLLGLEPAAAVVYEDALAGVAAGRAGNFGWVIGVDRAGQAAELKENGADIVVSDLEELIEQ